MVSHDAYHEKTTASRLCSSQTQRENLFDHNLADISPHFMPRLTGQAATSDRFVQLSYTNMPYPDRVGRSKATTSHDSDPGATWNRQTYIKGITGLLDSHQEMLPARQWPPASEKCPILHLG